MRLKELENMIEDHIKLYEQAGTFGADINEIMTGFYLGNGKWSIYGDSAPRVKEVVEKRSEQISPESFKDQDGRAKAQAAAAIDWARSNGYDGSISQVYWTARPGDLSRIVGVPVDSRKNPTDVLIRFSDGGFLGLSAKSTKSGGDIGFKNPGIGRLGRDLGVDLSGASKSAYVDVLKSLNWDGAVSTQERKGYLKKIAAGRKMNTVPELKDYYVGGAKVLKSIRDTLLRYYLSMDIDDLREHFLEEWVDAKDRYPYYIKVTGRGKNGNYSATVNDPLQDEKIKKISSDHIQLEELGNNSIGVWAGEGSDASKLFRIRLKWESAPLASSIKMSGDPQ